MEAEDLLDKFAQDEGFGNWDTVVLNCHHSVIRSVAIAAVKQALHQPTVSGSLPSLDDATKVAVRISEEAITPPPDAKEQAMFIAGFQECIKWLNVLSNVTL